jgi:hypothetical protein
MNIFATSKCPIECAKALDDKRTNKMILETSQMLSTALKYHQPDLYIKVPSNKFTKTGKRMFNHFFNGQKVSGPTHFSHPCNVWVRENRSNFNWAVEHFKALCIEKINRTKKPHKLTRLIRHYQKFAMFIPEGELTEHPNCAANDSKGISFKHIKNVYTAYKLYLNERWDTDVREPKWYVETR